MLTWFHNISLFSEKSFIYYITLNKILQFMTLTKPMQMSEINKCSVQGTMPDQLRLNYYLLDFIQAKEF